jgi:hypothetical protein
VSLTITVIQGSAAGTPVFTETHDSTTNEFGLLNIRIGSIQNLSTIDWSNGPYFMKVTMNGTELGVTQLLSVPYALHANKSDSSVYDNLIGLPAWSDSLAANKDTNWIAKNGNLYANLTGNVGIGADSAEYPLHVEGRKSGIDNGVAYFSNAGGNAVKINSSGSGVFIDSVGTGIKMSTIYNGIEMVNIDNSAIKIGAADEAISILSARKNAIEVIFEAEENGLEVASAGWNGVEINSADRNGIKIGVAGQNGLKVGGCLENGIYVGRAEDDGVYIEHADSHGVHIGSAEQNGIHVDSATGDGVHVDGAGGFAGYFNGDVHVTGSLTKGSGSFVIDHPEDPENKLLRHNFVESPENLCIYRGKVQLDANGKAIVEMPSYFVPLTKEEEATIHLTSIGKKPFLAGYEWNGGYKSFVVYGEANRDVSYTVYADRDDPAIKKLRKPVEQNKTESKLCTPGEYLHPDAY